ncbi:MAG: hypothetical protein ACREOI_23770, partial [bacterium]
MARLNGKVALISGAARGMGVAHARAMIAEGTMKNVVARFQKIDEWPAFLGARSIPPGRDPSFAQL